MEEVTSVRMSEGITSCAPGIPSAMVVAPPRRTPSARIRYGIELAEGHEAQGVKILTDLDPARSVPFGNIFGIRESVGHSKGLYQAFFDPPMNVIRNSA